MTRRRNIQARIHTLLEMAHIMDSMKTLALLETRKLARYLETQHRVVRGLEESAAAFLGGYPDSYRPSRPGRRIWLVLGSQRGLCGDFNDRLLRVLEHTETDTGSIILVGRKLYARRENDPRLVLALDGPAVAEEVARVLAEMVTRLLALQEESGPFALTVLSHDDATGRIEKLTVLPPFTELAPLSSETGYPPALLMRPAHFLESLVENYLFAVLHERLYTSLMMENRQRMEHLDGAIQHLSKTTAGLKLKDNYLRQEEITEELEELLLGSEAGNTAH